MVHKLWIVSILIVPFSCDCEKKSNSNVRFVNGQSCECSNEQLKANCKTENSKAIMRLIDMVMAMAMRHRYRLNRSNNAPNLHMLQTQKRRARQKHNNCNEVTTSNSLLSVWHMMFEHTYLADLHVIKTNRATRFVGCLGLLVYHSLYWSCL